MPTPATTPPGEVPGRVEIKAARESLGLTQTQAAAVVHCKLRAWQQWEAGDRQMHPAFWELFCIKTQKNT